MSDVRSLNYDQARDLFPPPKENVDRCQLFHSVHIIATLAVLGICETLYRRKHRVGQQRLLGPDPLLPGLGPEARRTRRRDTMVASRPLSRQERQASLAGLALLPTLPRALPAARSSRRDRSQSRRRGPQLERPRPGPGRYDAARLHDGRLCFWSCDAPGASIKGF